MQSMKNKKHLAYMFTVRCFFAFLWAMALLSLAVPSQAQGQENIEASEAALNAKWLEVTPPQGWERETAQNGLFRAF